MTSRGGLPGGPHPKLKPMTRLWRCFPAGMRVRIGHIIHMHIMMAFLIFVATISLTSCSRIGAIATSEFDDGRPLQGVGGLHASSASWSAAGQKGAQRSVLEPAIDAGAAATSAHGTSENLEPSVAHRRRLTEELGANLSSDVQALLALKEAFTDEGTYLDSWTDERNPCTDGFVGVQCNSGNTRVASISLRGKFFSGTLPPQLGDLTALTTFALDHNQLSGTIPFELGSLVSVQSLVLQGNQLSGTIPPELGSLVSVQSFDLVANQLSGTIPYELGSLVSVQSIALWSNQLSGTIPLELGSLVSVQSL
eukprot:jgi/Mesvir1/8933/Mv26123-RA.1